MFFAGVDVGSMAAKAVILDWNNADANSECTKGEKKIIGVATLPTGWSPKDAGRAVYDAALAKAGLSRHEMHKVIGTGYGRVALDFIDQAITEITCHGLGAAYYFPENSVIIDIGGQDSKVIKVNSQGKVLNFVMNDKCAAGTGRFLQVMALNLGLELDQLNSLANGEPVTLNSMCTVFAESEVVSLLAGGIAKEKIVTGIYQSIAKRVATMTGSVGTVNRVTFTGGVANNHGMQVSLAKILGCPVDVPENPQIIGALGAALMGAKLNDSSHEPINK